MVEWSWHYWNDWYWWHWVALGLIVLSVDVLFVNVFYLLWLGLGAVLTGVSIWLFYDPPLWVQMVMFGSYSILLLVLWLILLRPHYRGRQLRIAMDELPGQSAIVVRYQEREGRGELRLQRPAGGKDVWPFDSIEPVRPGDRVNIDKVDPRGHLLVAKAR